MLQRIKIVASIKRGKKNRNHSKFYGRYAVVVSRCLKKRVFLKFVNWILKREEIPPEQVKSVQIRMFPLVKNNGNSLIGRCKPDGEIFLYPKRLDVCKKKFQQMNPEDFTKYVEGRAMASLIHEVLHLKYESDETKVKQLTKKYFSIFCHHQNPEISGLTNYNNLIFNY